MGSTLSNGSSVASWQNSLRKFDSVLKSWESRQLSFHGPALVANTLGLSLFWYLSSFLPMPDSVVHSVNSRLFLFVWRKKREWLARSSVTQRPGQGGLGVIDLDRKISAIHAMWVRLLVLEGDLPSLYFFKNHLRVAFAGRPVDQILLLPASSKTALALLPPFYRSVMRAWFRLSRRQENGELVIVGSNNSFCSLRNLSVRFLYQQFSRLDYSPSRCVAKFSFWGLAVDWPTVWSNFHLWRCIRLVRDTNWLIAHGILPTADRLTRFGITVDSSCHCGQPESLVHLFTQCPLEKRLIAWYQVLVRRVLPTLSRPTPSQILVGYNKSVKIPPVFPCLLGIIRHQIWVARNGYRFDQSPVVYRSVLIMISIKSSFRFALRIQFRHCPRHLFTESWLAGGMIGYVSEEDIIVFHEDFV